MLEQAADEARQRKTTKLIVSAHFGPTESGDLEDQRTKAIADDLKQLGFTAAEVEVNHTYDQPPSHPSGYVSVCDLVDERELQKTPPSNPDRRAPYKVGAAELHIPLRYLSPYAWRNIPFELRSRGSVSLHLTWPGLQDHMSDVLRCTRIEPSSCTNRVFVRVIPTGSYQLDGALRQLPSRSDLIPIPGQLHGGRWFGYKGAPRRGQALMQAQDEDGRPTLVSCNSFNISAPATRALRPTLDDVKALTRESSNYCLMVVSLGPALEAEITFGAENITDWRAIKAGVPDLVMPWQVPASANSPSTETL